MNANSSPSNPSLVSIVNVSNSFNASFDLTNLVINSSFTSKDTLDSWPWFTSGTFGITAGSVTANLGTGLTAINFSGATVTYHEASGISTVTIAEAGLSTEFSTISGSPTPGITTYLDLSNAQDHKWTCSGIVTFSCTGGTEGDSHTVRVINSGITTVGFNTFFLWPGGSAPSMTTADGTVSLISFTVHRVGAGGTQLLAGASLNYSWGR